VIPENRKEACMRKPIWLVVVSVLAVMLAWSLSAAVSAQDGEETPTATDLMGADGTPDDGEDAGTPDDADGTGTPDSAASPPASEPGDDAATAPAGVPAAGGGPASGGSSTLLLIAVGTLALAGGTLIVAGYRLRS
jgi:hypothetical protein